jgi:hypothetical protein
MVYLALVPFSWVLLPMASISSIKMMHPFLQARALLKSYLILDAPTPTYIYSNSDAITLMKFNFDSLAKALANMVFPVPGGP